MLLPKDDDRKKHLLGKKALEVFFLGRCLKNRRGILGELLQDRLIEWAASDAGFDFQKSVPVRPCWAQ